ncbi:MFS transporter [Roseomonas terrae]|uniref:MFS transporter n=1 Tax=Neoroseomonas terrae TaxID=424799 RepID=A0ABS5EHY5_9PROT|nr:MFS transporter [Neoroseomonas terrae]MBR0650634.1 MFS transporter [Neoroseomonas terrae]
MTTFDNAPRETAGFFGWRVVWGAFTVAVLAWGVGFYGPSVFLHVLHDGRGWPVWVISAAITWHFLLSAGIVARLPALHRRFGLVAATQAGGVLAGLGVVAWALAPAAWMLFPAAVLSGAGWALTSGAAINAMVAPWFDRKRPMALSMAFNGASVGGVLFAPLWALLIGGLGFPAAAALRGAIMAGAVWWIAATLLRPTPASLGQRPDGAAAEAVGTAGATAADRPALPAGRAVWRDGRFRSLSVAFALGLFAQIGLIAHLFSLLVAALGEVGAGAAVSLTTACAVVGRSLLGRLLGEADRRRAAALNFAVQVAGSAAFLAAGGTSAPLLLLGCVLFGLGVGNLISLPPLIAQREFARGDVGRVVALVTATNQAVFAFAPALFGLLQDLSGSRGASILLALAVQAAAAMVVMRWRDRATTPFPV